MINLNTFIKQCENDLIFEGHLLEDTIASMSNLSEKDQILCNSVLSFTVRHPINIAVDTKDFEFLSEERILVCRLIPLKFALDSRNPTWSSYLLTEAIKSATDINGIKLSEIGIAFLEIFCEFNTPLNRVVKNFCIDLAREFTVNYRKRLSEFESLKSWENSNCQFTASVAFLRYVVPIDTIDSHSPKFTLKTMIALIENKYFEEFVESNKYLFEDMVYKQEFLECLLDSDLSKSSKDLILSVVNVG